VQLDIVWIQIKSHVLIAQPYPRHSSCGLIHNADNLSMNLYENRDLNTLYSQLPDYSDMNILISRLHQYIYIVYRSWSYMD